MVKQRKRLATFGCSALFKVENCVAVHDNILQCQIRVLQSRDLHDQTGNVLAGLLLSRLLDYLDCLVTVLAYRVERSNCQALLFFLLRLVALSYHISCRCTHLLIFIHLHLVLSILHRCLIYGIKPRLQLADLLFSHVIECIDHIEAVPVGLTRQLEPLWQAVVGRGTVAELLDFTECGEA